MEQAEERAGVLRMDEADVIPDDLDLLARRRNETSHALASWSTTKTVAAIPMKIGQRARPRPVAFAARAVTVLNRAASRRS